jgi:probable HAF family extracellular repeat protein
LPTLLATPTSLAFVTGNKVLLALVVVACSCSSFDAPTESTAQLHSSSALARVDLGTLGGPSSIAADVNNADIVVGSSLTSTGAKHAFRWSATTGMIDLGTLPGDDESEAVAIIDGPTFGDGQILGFSGGNGRAIPVVWSETGAPRALEIPLLPGAAFGMPTSFNAKGQVIGWDLDVLQHAWVWSTASGKYDLTANAPEGNDESTPSAITPSGTVLLTSRVNLCHRVSECWRTYLWSDRSGYQPLGTPDNDVDVAVAGLGINDNGTVVGSLTSVQPGASPYRWDPGVGFTLLPHYGSFADGYAVAVNSIGTVIGAEREPNDGVYVATAWPAGGGIVRLSPDDHNPSVAVAINASGTIAGWAAISETANHAVIWTSRASTIASPTVAAASARFSQSSTAARCLAEIGPLLRRQALTKCVMNQPR